MKKVFNVLKSSVVCFVCEFRAMLFGPQIVHVEASNNYSGLPPKDLSWDEAWKFYRKGIIPYHDGKLYSEKKLDNCPECGKQLIDYRSDFNADLNQHMVAGEYCPEGHYTHIKCA